jgi:hypothetical protein
MPTRESERLAGSSPFGITANPGGSGTLIPIRISGSWLSLPGSFESLGPRFQQIVQDGAPRLCNLTAAVQHIGLRKPRYFASKGRGTGNTVRLKVIDNPCGRPLRCRILKLCDLECVVAKGGTLQNPAQDRCIVTADSGSRPRRLGGRRA